MSDYSRRPEKAGAVAIALSGALACAAPAPLEPSAVPDPTVDFRASVEAWMDEGTRHDSSEHWASYEYRPAPRAFRRQVQDGFASICLRANGNMKVYGNSCSMASPLRICSLPSGAEHGMRMGVAGTERAVGTVQFYDGAQIAHSKARCVDKDWEFSGREEQYAKAARARARDQTAALDARERAREDRWAQFEEKRAVYVAERAAASGESADPASRMAARMLELTTQQVPVIALSHTGEMTFATSPEKLRTMPLGERFVIKVFIHNHDGSSAQERNLGCMTLPSEFLAHLRKEAEEDAWAKLLTGYGDYLTEEKRLRVSLVTGCTPETDADIQGFRLGTKLRDGMLQVTVTGKGGSRAELILLGDGVSFFYHVD